MKNNLHNPILLQTAQIIQMAIKDQFPEVELSLEEIYPQIGDAPKLEMGHLAFPCFPLAKVCRNAPNKISETLSKSISPNEIIEEAKPVGPYLNFFLKKKALGDLILSKILDGTFFKTAIFSDTPKTMVEYSQPNTHKILHVGHMRNLCLGNTLTKILDYCGYEVIPSTYPGDVGTHIAKCLWYVKHHPNIEIPKEHKGEWLGEVYTLATNKLEEEVGTDKEEKNREILTTILKQIEGKNGEYYDLWKETREWSLDLMKEAYDWADVKFDRWFFESEIDSYSLELAKKYLKEGKLVKDQGAIGMDLREDNLGFCILVKSDGTGNYACKDVALAQIKFDDFKIEKNIYVVDERQSYHFNQFFKVLENIGFEQAKDCHHLKYEMVELPDGAMSSRKGNIVPLMHLVHGMEKTIKEQYLNKYQGEWSQEEIDKTSTMVANGAIKYGMLRMDPGRKIVFNIDEWLKLDGETGPYLQYVHARIISLEDKIGKLQSDKINWDLLDHPAEIAIMVKLQKFNSIAQQACEQYNPSKITSYLYELGKAFNAFYAECPVGKADSKELKWTRLALSNSVARVMEKGMELLGIPAPPRM